jgi:hypothetical protein
MSINDTPANASLPEIAASETQTTPIRRSGDKSMQRANSGFARIRSAIGPSGVAIVASGVALAFGCTIWAIYEGVPHPLAIMIGYCTMVGSACLCTAPLVIQSLAAKVQGPAVQESASATNREPNYAAWRLVSKLSVSDASRLWCDIEPGCPASQESIAWGMAMLDAVKRGELVASAKADTSQAASPQEQSNPTWHTKIARDALKSWAQARGHSPKFLQN